jgi:DNA-binding response OmpR family regulator
MSSVASFSPVASAITDVLIVDGGSSAAGYSFGLRDRFRVNPALSVEAALQHLSEHSPALVITELALDGKSGVEVCRQAKKLPVPSTVLVMTSEVELVPDALIAGCDGVLLKPFAPNLLYARLGRLLRARTAALRLLAQRQYAKSVAFSERSDLLISGTNRHWPATRCPSCSHEGVTSFEFASHRTAWYACLECRNVWMAKRQE